VKKRALFALRALSEFEPALFHCIQNTIIDQLGDDDDSVVNATLALLSDHPPQVRHYVTLGGFTPRRYLGHFHALKGKK